MEKLILGFDLCDDVTKISRYRLDNMNPADISFPQADNRTVIQTALGRKKGQDGWLVGKEAYEAVLEGGGAVVDKLLTLLTKKKQRSSWRQAISARAAVRKLYRNAS